MDQDPDMAKLYQDIYQGTKADRENEYNQIVKVHEKYDYMFDGHTTKDKRPSKMFDL